MKISILHPSRSRPNKSIHTIKRWIERAGTDELEVIVSVDSDDPNLRDYEIGYPKHKDIKLIINPNRSAVDAVNKAAEVSTGNILIVVSDDFECPKDWGKWILSSIEGKEDYVLKINDGVQKWIVTMPIMDRKYYERFNYVYHPGYRHMFVDTHFTHVADCLKKIIWRNDILFPHKHYSVLRERPDEVNKRADATWEQGKSIYLKNVRTKFGLGVDIWDLSPEGKDHVFWLKKAL